MDALDRHECNALTIAAKHKHSKQLFYGPAIMLIEKINRGWVAHNDEYASIISYCPFCGKKLD